MVCILFSACHPRQENAGPLIEFTKVPRAGEGNPYKVSIIEGRVLGARPGQQIVLFARSGAWWVQPLADQPYTKIQPDSTWRNSTHPGMQYAALLVDPGYHPPAIIIVLPSAGGGVAAVATVEGEPFFWQTWWFRGSAGLALLAMVFGAFRFRVRNTEEREQQFRRLAENAPDIVMRLDPDLRYSYVNPIVEEYTGLPPGALLGKTNQEVGMFEESAQSWEAGLRQVFITGQPTMKEFTFNTPRGERHLESRLVPEFGADGSTKSVLAVTRDITDRKRAEEALQQAQAELARFHRVMLVGETAASIAHEVNQPIAATVTNAGAALRWLSAHPPDMEEARQALGRIVKDGNRAGEVIARVRALVGKSPPQKDRLDINDAILEVMRLTDTEVHRNRISLQSQLSNALPPILGDRIQLQQVILNLIKNAIEAMSVVSDRPRGLLVSSGKDESKGVLVAVRDSGPGLDPKALAHLFNPFYTTKPEGMGMGLAISRSIIEAHGGRLWATANDPHGAVFQFTLPADGDRMP